MFINVGEIWETFAKIVSAEGVEIEVCGYLVNKNTLDQITHCQPYPQLYQEIKNHHEELTPIVCGVAGNDGRPYCTYTKPYGSLLWHTHPFNSKPYPSKEDIIKSIVPRKNPNEIISCILVCRWGVWEWGATNKENYFEDQAEDIKMWLSENLRKIGLATGMDLATGRTARIDLNDDILVAITLFIREAERVFSILGFQIYFTSWETIKREHFPYYILKMI